MVDTNLQREQEYSNEWALHLIGRTESLSHAAHKYVLNLVEAGSDCRNECKWLALSSALQLIKSNM